MALPFLIDAFVPVPLTPTIADELRDLDPDVEVYTYREVDNRLTLTCVSDETFVNCALVLLGVSFHDEFYSRDQIDQFSHYFLDPQPYIRVFEQRPEVYRINPFAWQVELGDGTIRTWHFYGPRRSHQRLCPAQAGTGAEANDSDPGTPR